MKSKLFSLIDLGREESFCKDIKTLLMVPEQAMRGFADDSARSWLAPSKKETQTVREEVAKKMEIPPAILDHGFDVAEFFIREFLDTGRAVDDTAESLVDDLMEGKLISFEDRNKMVVFIGTLKELVATKLNFDNLKKEIAQTGLQNLRLVDATVNYRAVFDKVFMVDSRIDEFQPKCIGVVPIVVVTLKLTKGPIEDISFQVDMRSLKILIDNLRAAEKEFQIADKYLRLKSTEGKD